MLIVRVGDEARHDAGRHHRRHDRLQRIVRHNSGTGAYDQRLAPTSSIGWASRREYHAASLTERHPVITFHAGVAATPSRPWQASIQKAGGDRDAAGLSHRRASTGAATHERRTASVTVGEFLIRATSSRQHVAAVTAVSDCHDRLVERTADGRRRDAADRHPHRHAVDDPADRGLDAVLCRIGGGATTTDVGYIILTELLTVLPTAAA